MNIKHKSFTYRMLLGLFWTEIIVIILLYIAIIGEIFLFFPIAIIVQVLNAYQLFLKQRYCISSVKFEGQYIYIEGYHQANRVRYELPLEHVEFKMKYRYFRSSFHLRLTLVDSHTQQIILYQHATRNKYHKKVKKLFLEFNTRKTALLNDQ